MNFINVDPLNKRGLTSVARGIAPSLRGGPCRGPPAAVSVTRSGLPSPAPTTAASSDPAPPGNRSPPSD